MDLQTYIGAAAERGNAMPGIVYRGKARDWTFAFSDGAQTVGLRNVGGQFSLVTGGAAEAADVKISAPADAWDKLASSAPPPGYQTLMALVMTQQGRFEGDGLLLNQYGMALEVMLGTLPMPERSKLEDRPPRIEANLGRYVNLVHEGLEHRIYFEEAGQGIPLLCLHTAGADGRQYRALFNDEAITSRFRVICFDLPMHGKSSLHPAHLADQYQLTTDGYVAIVMKMIEALGLDRPVVMGCSIGGRAVLHLAMRHGECFRAAIGLQSALNAETHDDFSGASVLPIARPDANGPEIGAMQVAAITAPGATTDRWETLWYYMQGGPGVFMGDLFYYFVDGDLRNRVQNRIADNPCPLYLLTGEYDLSATPEMTAELAEAVGATRFEVMKGLGHFPMSENPEAFRGYLLPVLDEICAHPDGAAA